MGVKTPVLTDEREDDKAQHAKASVRPRKSVTFWKRPPSIDGSASHQLHRALEFLRRALEFLHRALEFLRRALEFLHRALEFLRRALEFLHRAL